MKAKKKNKRDRLDRIAAAFEKRIAVALLSAFDRIKNQSTLKEIEDAFVRGGMGAALQKFSGIEKVIGAALLKELSDAVVEGGRRIGTVLPKGALKPTFYFNSLDPNVIASLQGHFVTLVKDITVNTQLGIIQCLEAIIIAGSPPKKMAKEIKRIVGLTPSQQMAVRNYERALKLGNKSALESVLRDKRSDASILKMIQGGRPLSRDRVTKLVDSYRDRLLNHRVTTIARTEAMRALSMGEYESLVQAENAGELTVQLLRFWVSAKDERTRYSHREMPRINKNGVSIKGSFVTPRGYLLRYPRDPSAPAGEVVNCRCRIVYKTV